MKRTPQSTADEIFNKHHSLRFNHLGYVSNQISKARSIEEVTRNKKNSKSILEFRFWKKVLSLLASK